MMEQSTWYRPKPHRAWPENKPRLAGQRPNLRCDSVLLWFVSVISTLILQTLSFWMPFSAVREKDGRKTVVQEFKQNLKTSS